MKRFLTLALFGLAAGFLGGFLFDRDCIPAMGYGVFAGFLIDAIDTRGRKL